MSGLFRRVFGGGFSPKPSPCTHQDFIKEVTPRTQGCEECLKTGDTWVHLRICMTCGKVGCCDASKGRHASSHYHETGHPIIKSGEPNEQWMWCYADNMRV
jgi:monovalent cation:H+ antiporter-2, CPA2 family